MKELVAAFLLLALPAGAIEQKDLAHISVEQLVQDTQVQSTEEDHLAIAWWIPYEYWETLFARDENTTEKGREAILAALQKYTMVGVTQADISPLGAFDYYAEKEVAAATKLSFQKDEEEPIHLEPIEEIDANLRILLETIRPILARTMGDLGTHFYFLILPRFDAENRLLLDPYGSGHLVIELGKRDASTVTSTIDLPLNALFVPRLCPNGEEAHVTWNFCPWTGEKLPE
ncbi:MAG: hypothetical protein AAF191_09585 [Verrucomicrobiota bacterium]